MRRFGKLCARHRRAVLAKARGDLEAGRPVRLVATSLIEAGVDISFPEVWHATVGLSNIAQAAGRCNRSGELGPLGEAFGRTVVFEPASVEGRKPAPDMIRPFYQAARNVLRAGTDDVLGLVAVREYYRWLYWELGGENYDAFDAAKLEGERFPTVEAIRNTARKLEFPFAKIARAFRMIDEIMDPVIVPWGDNEEERGEIETLLRRRTGDSPRCVWRPLRRFAKPLALRSRSRPAPGRSDMAVE